MGTTRWVGRGENLEKLFSRNQIPFSNAEFVSSWWFCTANCVLLFTAVYFCLKFCGSVYIKVCNCESVFNCVQLCSIMLAYCFNVSTMSMFFFSDLSAFFRLLGSVSKLRLSYWRFGEKNGQFDEHPEVWVQFEDGFVMRPVVAAGPPSSSVAGFQTSWIFTEAAECQYVRSWMSVPGWECYRRMSRRMSRSGRISELSVDFQNTNFCQLTKIWLKQQKLKRKTSWKTIFVLIFWIIL